MSLKLINPLSSITTNSSRTSRSLLLSKGQELSSGLKDKKNNITDNIVGNNLKNSSKLMNAVKLNSLNAVNTTKQAEVSLDQISNMIRTIKELSVTASSTYDKSTIDSLNARYKNEVRGLIKYIDQASFQNTDLFNGELENFKVRIGEDVDHNINVSIPKLLVTYKDLGVNDELSEKHKKQNEILLEIGTRVKNLRKEIQEMEKKIDITKEKEILRNLFDLQKSESEDQYPLELKKLEDLELEVNKSNLAYSSKKHKLGQELDETELKLVNLKNLKQHLEDEINIKNGELNLNLQKLEKKKKENLEYFIENDDLLTKAIAEKQKEFLEIKDTISKTTEDRDLNKAKLEKVSQEIGVLSDKTKKLQEEIDPLKEKQKNVLLKHSALEEKLKNQASIPNQNEESIKKKINKEEKSIIKSQNKIETYKTELEKIPQRLENEKKDKLAEENEILDTKNRLSTIQSLEVQVPLREQIIKEELESRYLRLNNINQNISTFEENLETYKSGIKKEEDKVVEANKKIKDLTDSLNSQNEQIGIQLELGNVNKELESLNKKIENLEKQIVLNNKNEKSLQTAKKEISELYNKNIEDISSFNNKLNSIKNEISKLENEKSSISESNAHSHFEEEITKIKEDFNLNNKTLLDKLNNIKEEMKSVSLVKQETANQILLLNKSYIDENNALDLKIKKQKELCSEIKQRISDLSNKIADMDNSESDDIESIGDLQNELSDLNKKEDELIEQLSQIKSEIEDFTNVSNSILKNHGGLFIREELENSNLIDAFNIRRTEEMLDTGIDKLFTISSNTNQTQLFLTESSDKITNSINLLNEVSDHFLSTNYQESSKQYKQASLSLHAQMSIRAQGDIVLNEILKRIENQ